MGENINLLSERIIGNKGMDAGTRLELHENVHFHYKDSRFVLGGKDFYNIAKMFEDGVKKFVEMGMPESCNDAKLLAETNLRGIDGNVDGYHSNRLGCELTSDGTIHIHYRDLRIHLKKTDFLIFANVIRQGLLTLNEANCVILPLNNIKDDINNQKSGVFIPDIAILKYLPLLKKYDEEIVEGKIEQVSAEDVIKLNMETKFYERLGDKNIQRPNGLNDLGLYPGLIPEELDNRYLYSIYESIKKYGYAKGPFLNEYIIAYKLDGVDRTDEGRIYIKDAHRIASLIHLGYKEIMVTLVDPEN